MIKIYNISGIISNIAIWTNPIWLLWMLIVLMIGAVIGIKNTLSEIKRKLKRKWLM